MNNYLSIDYGTKRIGIARSISTFADPLAIIPNNEQTLDKISEYCREFQIDEILFGLSDHQMAEETKQFAQKIKVKLHLPIHFFDESFSSKEVIKLIQQSGKPMLKRQEPIDHYVAAYILEQFLEQQNL